MTKTNTPADVTAPCGAPGDTTRGGDLSSTWTCKRNAQAFMLLGRADEIARTERRILTRRSEFARRNLTAWVADARTRLAKLTAHIASDATPCTCD